MHMSHRDATVCPLCVELNSETHNHDSNSKNTQIEQDHYNRAVSQFKDIINTDGEIICHTTAPVTDCEENKIVSQIPQPSLTDYQAFRNDALIGRLSEAAD